MPRLPAISILAWCLAGATALFLLALATADERARSLWFNSLFLGGCVAAIAVPSGTLLALLIGRCELPGRWLAIPLLAFALFLPLYLHAAGWQAGFGTQGWFTLFFWPEGIPPPLFAWRGAILIHSLVAIPWTTLLIAAGLSQLPAEPEEGAAIEGGTFASLMYVTLPLLAPQIALATLWVVVSTIAEMTVTDLFAVRTIAEEVFLGFARDSLEDVELAVVPAIAGIGCLVLAAAIVAMGVAPWEASAREPRRWKLGWLRFPASAAVLLGAGLLVGVPLANLAAKGGWLVVGEGEARMRTWSAAALWQVIVSTPRHYAEEIGASLRMGIAAASLAWLFAIPAWWGRRGWGSGAVLSLAAIGLAIPGPFIGLALIQAFNHPDVPWLHPLYNHSVLVPMIAQMVRAFPLVLLLVWQAFASLPREIEELASLDGAKLPALWGQVVFPMRWPALTCAWIAGLALAMGDLAGSVLVKPPGVNTVSWQVFELLHSGVDDRLAGLCIVWSGLFALITGAAILCYQWQRDEKLQENIARNQSAGDGARPL